MPFDPSTRATPVAPVLAAAPLAVASGALWTPSTTVGHYPDPIPLVIPHGGISLLAGAPGVGKTAFLATLLKAFRDHQEIFGHQPSTLPAAGIGIVSADRSWDSTKIWFERAGWPNIPVYSIIDDPAFVKSRLRKKHDRVHLLQEFIDKLQLPRGGLVVVDPISLFLGGNLLDYDTCMTSCMEIRDLLRTRSLSCIATAHASKQKSDKNDRYLRLQDRILGSTALFGFTDTQMYLAAPEEIDRPHYAFLWQPHMLPVETFELARDSKGLFIPYDGTESGKNSQRLLELFPEDGSPIERATLIEKASQIPLALSTIKYCLRVLLADGSIVRVSHGTYARAAVIH